MTPEEGLLQLLLARGWTLSTAESCTGGLVAHRLTNISGSSACFLGGVVSYSNQAKAEVLGVSWETLNARGAVSRETVLEMARGARSLFHTDLAVSISGIAGPTGAMPGKPVGTTWLGLAAASGEWARHFTWDGDRETNKRLSADAALQFILDLLEGSLP